jgi:bifunctional N-acetylglucosamine-1-phosphate-uridyltransferase/glucosamine-1-phosphate-acetyltransferase GlmU-like protein
MTFLIPKLGYSVIVAAAGNSTRMKSPLPKSLTKVGASTLLEVVLTSLKDNSEQIILVIKEEHLNIFQNSISSKLNERTLFAFQNTASGTFHSVKIGLENSSSEFTFVVWGDHIGAAICDVKNILNAAKTSGADLLVPLVMRPNPYVYFDIDIDGSIVEFVEPRKDGRITEIGYSDTGVFLMRTSRMLEAMSKIDDIYNEAEVNFLGMFTRLRDHGLTLKTLLCEDELLTLGANTKDELNLSWSLIKPRIAFPK